MKITISTLFIISAIFLHSIESSSHGAGSSGSSENAPRQSPLDLIPGLKIPQGEKLRHRHQIIAVNQNGVVLPFMHLDSFTILKPMGKKSKNNPALFEPLHVSDDEWLVYVAAYAKHANRLWVLDSAIRTITGFHLAKVEAQRKAQRAADHEAQNAAQHEAQPAGNRAHPHRPDSIDLELARLNLNTHSRRSTARSGFDSSASEYQGTPRPLTMTEIQDMLNNYKKN